MHDEGKTRAELIEQLRALRSLLSKSQESEVNCSRADDTLRIIGPDNVVADGISSHHDLAILRMAPRCKDYAFGCSRAEEAPRQGEERFQPPGDQSPLAMCMVEELKQPQALLVQRDKMASIGQLAAGVAHEINNPIGFISSNLNTLGEYLCDVKMYLARVEEMHRALRTLGDGRIAPLLEGVDQLKEKLDLGYILDDVDGLIRESVEGSQRVRKIVQDLKTFARADTGEFQQANINSILDSALNIVWNQLKYTCTVVKEYGAVHQIHCNSNQLVQVFINMLVNAGQAIERGNQGNIRLRTYSTQDMVLVEIADNGRGIPPRDLDRIYDPFFTTKPIGQGTGLGLSISYSLIKNHGGRIRVDSEVGVGTTFTVELPVDPPLHEKSADVENQR